MRQDDAALYECINTTTHSLAHMSIQSIVPNFFHYLWLKDNTLRSCPEICVPDTVILINGEPVEWFAMSKDGKRIHKKRADRTNLASVLRAFQRRTSYCSGSIVASLTKVRRNVGGDADVLAEAFHTRESLAEALALKPPPRYAVLQRFVDPHSAHNTVFRVLYRGVDTSIEQCRNVYALADESVPLNERCVTFGAHGEHAQVVPFTLRTSSDQLIAALHRRAFGAVFHTRQHTTPRVLIHAANLHFKQDPAGRVWFLFASHVAAETQLTRREHSLRAKVVRRMPSRALEPGASSAPPRVVAAVKRFKDLRTAVLSGKQRASDPAFVCALLSRELSHVRQQTVDEQRRRAQLAAQVAALEEQLLTERLKTERLRAATRADADADVDDDASAWLARLSLAAPDSL